MSKLRELWVGFLMIDLWAIAFVVGIVHIVFAMFPDEPTSEYIVGNLWLIFSVYLKEKDTNDYTRT